MQLAGAPERYVRQILSAPQMKIIKGSKVQKSLACKFAMVSKTDIWSRICSEGIFQSVWSVRLNFIF